MSENYFDLVAKFESNIDHLNNVLTGDENTTVIIDGQAKPSITKDITDKINALNVGQQSGVIGYATKADLTADLSYGDKVVAYVLNDSVLENNGTYRKSGASGTGSWVQNSSDWISLAYQNAEKANRVTEILDIQTLAANINMFDANHASNITGQYLTVTGSLAGPISSYTVSHFIPLKNGDILNVSPGALPTSSACVCFYDADLNFVRSVAGPTSIMALSGEYYVRVSIRHDTTNSPSLLDVVLTTSIEGAGISGIRYSRSGKYNIELPSKDIFPEGKMELTLPSLRNGEGFISDSSTIPKFYGFKNSIKCSQVSNTYAYKNESVGGKSYIAMFFSFHTGGSDAPINDCVVLGSALDNTSLVSVADGNSLNIDCGSGVTLHVKPIKFPIDHLYFYIGTTKSFPTTTAEIFGIALFDKRESDATGLGLAKAYINDCMGRSQRLEVLNKVKGISDILGEPYELGRENMMPNGMFDNKYPLVRSGSPIVDCNVTELHNLGFDKAMLQRRTGNDYCYVTDQRLSGKRVYCAVLCHNADNSNSPIAILTSIDPLQTLSTAPTINSRSRVISGGLRLHSKIVNIASLHNTVYIGTSITPSTDSYWAGHYVVDATGLSTEKDFDKLEAQYLSEIKNKLSRKSIVQSVREVTALTPTVISNKLRIDALEGITETSGAYLMISGEEAKISGTKFQRGLIPFTERTDPRVSLVFNYKDDFIDGVPMYAGISNDDVAPIHAMGTTLMANHSYSANFVTVSGHGKTSADIGSLYTNEANTYVLCFVSTNELGFMRSGSNSNALSSTGTMVYLSGGVNNSNVIFTANTTRQLYPCYSNYSKNTFVDNILITSASGTKKYKDTVIFNESYDLLERQDIYDWYVNNYSGQIKPIGDGILNYSGSFRFDFEGNCTQSGSYTAIDSFLMSDIMALQSVRKSTIDYYIPKTLPFTYAGSTVDFSKKASSTTASASASQSSIFFTQEKLDDSAIPSDRWVQINSDGTYFAMGFLPRGDSGENRANNVTAMTCEIRGNTDKIYPRLLDIGDFTTTPGQSWSFVGYRNVGKPQGDETCSYPVRTGGDDYYYIDYHNIDGFRKLVMPNDFVGRTFSIVESRNITVAGSLISNSMTLNVRCINDYGYLVLKVSS